MWKDRHTLRVAKETSLIIIKGEQTTGPGTTTQQRDNTKDTASRQDEHLGSWT